MTGVDVFVGWQFSGFPREEGCAYLTSTLSHGGILTEKRKTLTRRVYMVGSSSGSSNPDVVTSFTKR
jgi:hypothetical protein